MPQTYDSRQKMRELAEYLTSYSVIIAVITYLSLSNTYYKELLWQT